MDVKTESSGVFAFVLFVKINPDEELSTVDFWSLFSCFCLLHINRLLHVVTVVVFGHKKKSSSVVVKTG